MQSDIGRVRAPELAAVNAGSDWIGLRDQMIAVVNRLFESYAPAGLSWVGFYIDTVGAPDGERLILGPCRNSPACSPIGLHGACGQCLLSGKPLLIADVRTLGANYIACDPRDRSELVLPCFDRAGRVWAVLDADSHAVGHFTTAHVEQMTTILQEAALTCPRPHG